MKKTAIARTISLSMALMMVFTSFSWAESVVTKEETVYVNLSHKGKVEKITVSDWLHSESMDVEFDDVSILDDIRNVKGEEIPSVEGNRLSWKTDRGEIYYQGSTNKRLPLEFEIDYSIDGKEISPELLAGASGKLQITMKITNNDANEVMLSSGKKVLYTPFAVATVFNFPTDTCRNMTVNTGKILNDGNKTIVTYAAVPGLEESLDIDDEDFDDMFDLPEELILEADVYDFEMGDILITAVSDSSILDEIEGFDDIIDETVDGVEDLSDASEEVQDGIETLNEGTDELQSKFGEFNQGMFFIKNAMSLMEDNINGRILDGSIDLTEGVEEFKGKTDELKDGTEKLYDGSKELEDGIRDAYWGSGDLRDGSSALTGGIEQMLAAAAGGGMDTDAVKDAVDNAVKQAVEQAVAGVIDGDPSLTDDQKNYFEAAASAAGDSAGEAAGQAIQDSLDEKVGALMNALGGGLGDLLSGSQALGDGIGTLRSGLKALYEGAEDFNDGMKELDDNAELFQLGACDLSDGAKQLTDGLGDLGEGAAALFEGVDELADASDATKKGIGTLRQGAEDLFEGYDAFDEEGVEELHDKVIEKTDEYNELFERKDLLAELSDRYDNFSGIGENTDGKLKFVIKIDSIELEELDEEVPEVEVEKTGFIDWVKRTWNKVFKK